MPDRNKTYRLLRGGSGSLVRQQSLWLADDHLLSVVRIGYREEYRRFYFRDIQAITVRKTLAGPILTGVLAIPWLLSAGFYLAATLGRWGDAAIVTFAVLAILFVVPIAVHLLLGATCRTEIYTAVQTEHLACLSRFRGTLRVIRRLREYIEAVQGPLADTHGTNVRENTESAYSENRVPVPRSVADAVRGPAAANRPRKPLVPYTSRTHDILFAILVFDALHTVAVLATRSMAVNAVGIPLGIAMLGITAWALVKQGGTLLSRTAKRLTWGALAYQVATQIAVQVMGTFEVAQGRVNPTEFFGLQRHLAEVPLAEAPVLTAWLALTALVATGLGVAGMSAMRRFRENPPRPSVAPAAHTPPRETDAPAPPADEPLPAAPTPTPTPNTPEPADSDTSLS